MDIGMLEASFDQTIRYIDCIPPYPQNISLGTGENSILQKYFHSRKESIQLDSEYLPSGFANLCLQTLHGCWCRDSSITRRPSLSSLSSFKFNLKLFYVNDTRKIVPFPLNALNSTKNRVQWGSKIRTCPDSEWLIRG